MKLKLLTGDWSEDETEEDILSPIAEPITPKAHESKTDPEEKDLASVLNHKETHHTSDDNEKSKNETNKSNDEELKDVSSTSNDIEKEKELNATGCSSMEQDDIAEEKKGSASPTPKGSEFVNDPEIKEELLEEFLKVSNDVKSSNSQTHDNDDSADQETDKNLSKEPNSKDDISTERAKSSSPDNEVTKSVKTDVSVGSIRDNADISKTEEKVKSLISEWADDEEDEDL